MNTENEEKELVNRACRGDMSAFQELVERYKKKIYYLAFDMVGDHHEAEDLSQEVFIKAFRFIKKFRKEAKVSSWLYRIAVNTCIDAQRKKSSKPQVSMENEQLESAFLASNRRDEDISISEPERLAGAEIVQERIRRMLGGISPRERSVFILRYYNEFGVKEIAAVLKVSSNTIKSLLLRARRKLKKELLSTGGYPL
ncbi:MAG: RNA polymerase sigma factor [Candidatus Aminicenantes bacterium]|nr:RNA polymerase sigma factor [Candidatus Aminicenantes bacterium]